MRDFLAAGGDHTVHVNHCYMGDVSFEEFSAYFVSPFPEGGKFDVCIIGAGLAGLSTALHIAEMGLSVIILEAARVAWGASGRNGGQVSSVPRHDILYPHSRMSNHMEDVVWEYSTNGNRLLKDIIARLHIDCSWKDGMMTVSRSDSFTEWGDKYIRYIQERYGYNALSLKYKSDLTSYISGGSYTGGIYDTEGGHLNPVKLSVGIACEVSRLGGVICDKTMVVNIQNERPCKIYTADDKVVCADYVVMCCNAYRGRLYNYDNYILPVNSFIIATDVLPVDVRNSIIKQDIAFADDAMSPEYFRLNENGGLIFGATESFSPVYPRNYTDRVKKRMLQVFPELADYQIPYSWGGTLAITSSRLPNFTREGNIISISGWSGEGIHLSVMGGKVVSDEITGTGSIFRSMNSIANVAMPQTLTGTYYYIAKYAVSRMKDKYFS